MNKRLLIVCLGIISGIFLAGGLRAEHRPPRPAEFEEFRAIMNNMLHLALPHGDYDYISSRKERFKAASASVGRAKPTVDYPGRERIYKKAREYFINSSGRFLDIMTTEKHDLVRRRLHMVDTAFAYLSITLAGPPPAVTEFAAVVEPLIDNDKSPHGRPPSPADLAALRHATERLLNTKIGGDYRVVQNAFDYERNMVVRAVDALGPAIATGNPARIDATIRGLAASSRRLALVFTPRGF